MTFAAFIRSVFRKSRTVPHGRDVLHDAFGSALDNYTEAYDATEPFTSRAGHRDDPILTSHIDPAARLRSAAITLQSHSNAMDHLLSAFEQLTTLYAGFAGDDALMTIASEACETSRKSCEHAAKAFSMAASFAVRDALEADIQTVKDKYHLLLLNDRLSQNPSDAVLMATMAVAQRSASSYSVAMETLKETAAASESKADNILSKLKTPIGDSQAS